jgi:hypothetical protein
MAHYEVQWLIKRGSGSLRDAGAHDEVQWLIIRCSVPYEVQWLIKRCSGSL